MNKFRKVKTSSCVIEITNNTNCIFKRNGRVRAFIWEDKFFFLTRNFNKNDNKNKNIYVQMLGTKAECLKHKVVIEVKDEMDTCSLAFGGHPFPVDMDEEEKEDAGLIIRSKDIEKFCHPKEGQPDKYRFRVTVKFM